MQNTEMDQQDQEILALLKDYPMPEAAAGYYDQALVRATHEGSRRQRNRWLLTGFGSAIAAGLAIWMIGGFFFTTPELPGADPTIPGVTMTLAEPRTINLVFASTEALNGATLTVQLPPGIEMSGLQASEINGASRVKGPNNLTHFSGRDADHLRVFVFHAWELQHLLVVRRQLLGRS